MRSWGWLWLASWMYACATDDYLPVIVVTAVGLGLSWMLPGHGSGLSWGQPRKEDAA